MKRTQGCGPAGKRSLSVVCLPGAGRGPWAEGEAGRNGFVAFRTFIPRQSLFQHAQPGPWVPALRCASVGMTNLENAGVRLEAAPMPAPMGPVRQRGQCFQSCASTACAGQARKRLAGFGLQVGDKACGGDQVAKRVAACRAGKRGSAALLHGIHHPRQKIEIVKLMNWCFVG